jgi:hypothetical protein
MDRNGKVPCREKQMARAIVGRAGVLLLPALLLAACGGGGGGGDAPPANLSAQAAGASGAATATASGATPGSPSGVATGAPSGAATTPSPAGEVPAGAVRLAGGGWVALSTVDEFAAGSSIRVQRYDAAGAAVGTAVAANEPGAPVGLAHVIALAGGGFAVTWMGQDGSLATGYGYDLPLVYTYARTFDAAGQPAAAPLRVSTSPSYSYTVDTPTALAGGGLVVLWAVDTSYPNLPGYRTPTVYQRVVGSDGTPVNAETLVFDTYSAPSAPVFNVTPHADGGFTLAWQRTDPGGMTPSTREYDAQGNATGPAQPGTRVPAF